MRGSYCGPGMRISQTHLDQLIAHAQEEAPKECCGYARLRDGRVEEVFRAVNELDSKFGFRLDAQSMLAAFNLEESGFGVAAYHSHPRSPAVPSQQDRNVSEWPTWLNLIVSLEGEPEVRAWWIKDRDVEEEPLQIE